MSWVWYAESDYTTPMQSLWYYAIEFEVEAGRDEMLYRHPMLFGWDDVCKKWNTLRREEKEPLPKAGSTAYILSPGQ